MKKDEILLVKARGNMASFFTVQYFIKKKKMNNKNWIVICCIVISFVTYMVFFIYSLQKKNENLIKDNEYLVKHIEEVNLVLDESKILNNKIKTSNRVILNSTFNNAWLQGCIACMSHMYGGKIDKQELDSIKTSDSLIFVNHH